MMCLKTAGWMTKGVNHDQMPQILIRCHILWHLILVYTVCTFCGIWSWSTLFAHSVASDLGLHCLHILWHLILVYTVCSGMSVSILRANTVSNSRSEAYLTYLVNFCTKTYYSSLKLPHWDNSNKYLQNICIYWVQNKKHQKLSQSRISFSEKKMSPTSYILNHLMTLEMRSRSLGSNQTLWTVRVTYLCKFDPNPSV